MGQPRAPARLPYSVSTYNRLAAMLRCAENIPSSMRPWNKVLHHLRVKQLQAMWHELRRFEEASDLVTLRSHRARQAAARQLRGLAGLICRTRC